MKPERAFSAPKPPQAPPSPKLRLVGERYIERESKMVEEELSPVTEKIEGFNEQLFTIDIAQKFLALADLSSQAQKDTKYNVQMNFANSDLQNLLVRAIHTGHIGNFDRFKKGFKEVLHAFLGERDLMVRDMPLSAYSELMFDGVEADVKAIRNLEKGFADAKREGRVSPDTHMLLATNDYLDAGAKTDVVQVVYRAEGDKTTVDEIRFVQVKRSQIPDSEIEKIQRVHEGYIRHMISEREFKQVKLTREAKEFNDKLKTFRINDMYGALAPFFESLKSFPEGAIKDEDIEKALGKLKVPVAVLKARFADPKSKEVLMTFFDAAGVMASKVGTLTERLMRWAIEHPYTSEEKAAAIGSGKPPAAVIGNAKFMSVVLHGDRVTKLPINPGEAKALTAA